MSNACNDIELVCALGTGIASCSKFSVSRLRHASQLSAVGETEGRCPSGRLLKLAGTHAQVPDLAYPISACAPALATLPYPTALLTSGYPVLALSACGWYESPLSGCCACCCSTKCCSHLCWAADSSGVLPTKPCVQPASILQAVVGCRRLETARLTTDACCTRRWLRLDLQQVSRLCSMQGRQVQAAGHTQPGRTSAEPGGEPLTRCSACISPMRELMSCACLRGSVGPCTCSQRMSPAAASRQLVPYP